MKAARICEANAVVHIRDKSSMELNNDMFFQLVPLRRVSKLIKQMILKVN